MNDPLELAMLLEYGKRFTHWERVPPGSSVKKSIPGYLQARAAGSSSLKMHPGKPSPTLPKMESAPALFTITHWGERRKFTLTEYQRFFGIPEGFKWPARERPEDRWSLAVARMGNCVPPLLTRAVALRLRQILTLPGKMQADEQKPA